MLSNKSLSQESYNRGKTLVRQIILEMVYGDDPRDMIKSEVFEGRVNIRKTMANH
jgi:hypothetical protein